MPGIGTRLKQRFLVISDGNPLGSPISSSLVVVREKLIMWSGSVKKSSIQEEDFQSYRLFVVFTKLRETFVREQKVPSFIERVLTIINKDGRGQKEKLKIT